MLKRIIEVFFCKDDCTVAGSVLAVPAASVVAGVAYLQSVRPSVAVAQEPHGGLVHTGALDAGGQGLRFPAHPFYFLFLLL